MVESSRCFIKKPNIFGVEKRSYFFGGTLNFSPIDNAKFGQLK